MDKVIVRYRKFSSVGVYDSYFNIYSGHIVILAEEVGVIDASMCSIGFGGTTKQECQENFASEIDRRLGEFKAYLEQKGADLRGWNVELC